MIVNKIDEVSNSANLLFKWIFGLLSPKNFATMATWRNDFSSLCIAFYIFYIAQCICQLIKHWNLILSTYTLNFLITQPKLSCTHIQSQAAQAQYESLIIDTG